MPDLIKQIWTSKDASSAVLLTAIIGVAIWIVALPLSSSVQETYLKRFHLTTPSFVTWAIQQPVPAMYNLENRFWFRRTRLTQDELDLLATGEPDCVGADQSEDAEPIQTDAINHFPTRTFTFAYSRLFLKRDTSGYFYLRSRYRDREIRSLYQVVPLTESEFAVKRLESTLD
jgi:hypothetical protein